MRGEERASSVCVRVCRGARGGLGVEREDIDSSDNDSSDVRGMMLTCASRAVERGS